MKKRTSSKSVLSDAIARNNQNPLIYYLNAIQEIEINMNAIVPFIPQLVDEEPREPYIGMEFQSLDILFKFYLDYAHRNGFSVCKNRITRSRKDKSIIGQEFVCSKEEFRSKMRLGKGAK
ncbi:hypothetical protein RND71_010942 [Anisodus tanguticus]|uniref:FAR1 domain-containing protein n=1 Tax=Anisodus tanguticus TaxID=243964 RepID=A0AAE1VJK6_9SOLA|nr:hypothetical protein RND71_010942 [Anisodus tanguticus]